MEIWNIVLTALLVLTTIVSTFFAIYYKQKETKALAQKSVNISSLVKVFFTREAMLSSLHSMYDVAKSGDIIWGQSVSGRNYGQVADRILVAASKGVSFKFLFNKEASSINQVKGLFEKIPSAQVKESMGNNLRIQGLSTELIVIAISDLKSYVGIEIRDPAIVRVFYDWFNNRFDEV